MSISPRPDSRPGLPARRRWRCWLALAAFFLTAAGWALALPANGTYDEKDHVVRAYAVYGGHLLPRETVIDRRGDRKPAYPFPATLLPSNASADCAWSPRPAKPASCQQWMAGPGSIETPTGAALYSPVYYALVGAPLVFAQNLVGIDLARLLSALLSAALLAAAVYAALVLGSRLLVLAGVLVATPMVLNLSASINPNGLEIVAGITVFCTVLALLRAPDDRLDRHTTRRLLLLAGAATLLLMTVRQLGPVLLALDVGACALLARRGRIRALWRRRDARWILSACCLAGAAYAIGWLAYSGLLDIAPNVRDAQHLSLAHELHLIFTWRVPFYLKQVVGQFGYGETDLSPVAIAAWYVLIGALVVPCLLRARARFSLVAVGLALAGIGLLVVLELLYVPRIGWFAHGRYAMPALVGVVLCAASAPGFEQRLVRAGRLRLYAGAIATIAAGLHVYALVLVMARFQSGLHGPLDPWAGVWHPPSGSPLPLAATVCGAVLLVVLVVSMPATPLDPDHTSARVDAPPLPAPVPTG